MVFHLVSNKVGLSRAREIKEMQHGKAWITSWVGKLEKNNVIVGHI